MYRLFLFVALLSLLNNCFSQDSIRKATDTVQYGNYQLVLFDNYTWEYVNHNQVLSEFRYADSIRIYNHILNNKVYTPDIESLFMSDWDTTNTHSYGGIDYFEVSDTLAIPLLTDTSFFTMPSEGILQSKFGWRWGRIHNGIDLKLESGDSVVAAFDGVVRFAGWNRGGYGNLVIIRHYNGLESYYAHLLKINVVRNQEIKSGDLVGLGGRTGRAYGDHLHFELRYKDNSFDPEIIIDPENKSLKSDTLILLPEHFAHIKELSQAQYHTVSQGDTLWGISRRFGVSVSFLCQLNGITQDTPLKIGQRLRVR